MLYDDDWTFGNRYAIFSVIFLLWTIVERVWSNNASLQIISYFTFERFFLFLLQLSSMHKHMYLYTRVICNGKQF